MKTVSSDLGYSDDCKRSQSWLKLWTPSIISGYKSPTMFWMLDLPVFRCTGKGRNLLRWAHWKELVVTSRDLAEPDLKAYGVSYSLRCRNTTTNFCHNWGLSWLQYPSSSIQETCCDTNLAGEQTVLLGYPTAYYDKQAKQNIQGNWW